MRCCGQTDAAVDFYKQSARSVMLIMLLAFVGTVNLSLFCYLLVLLKRIQRGAAERYTNNESSYSTKLIVQRTLVETVTHRVTCYGLQ